jgi:hypothetical protein
VKEFDTIFDKLYGYILTNLRTPTTTIHVLYMNVFEGKFGFILKDKTPDTVGCGA